MTVQGYTPEEAGPKVGQTAYWMKRKAQQKKIPSRKVGRKVLFTDDDIAEILQMFARRPDAAAVQTSSPRRPRRRTAPQAAGQAAPLVAKPPKRRGTAA